MTKKQAAYFMSFFSFRLVLALVGILIGLLIARWIWGRLALRYSDAESEIGTLRKDIADQVTKNSRLRTELNAKLELSGVEGTSAETNRRNANIDSDRTEDARLADASEVRHVDSNGGESSSPESESNSMGVAGFVSDTNSGSKIGPSSMPSLSSDVHRDAAANEGVGFVAREEGWNHENQKTVPLQVGSGTSGPNSGNNSGNDSEQSLDLPPVHGPKLNWSELDGMQPKLAETLEEMGLQNINQLEAMSYDQRKVLEAKLESKGLSWNWNWLRGWKAGLAESHGKQKSTTGGSLQAGEAKDESSSSTLQALNLNIPQAIGPDTEWSGLDELDPRLETELKALGIRNVEQLASLSFDDRRKLERHFSIKNINWDWNKVEKWRSAQEESSNSANFGTSSEQPKTDDGSTGNTTTRSGFTSADSGWKPVVGFAAGGPKTSVSSESGLSESSSAANRDRPHDPNKVPVLYTEVPEFRDDLTLLDGIDGPQSIELRQMGIYNFSQLHNLPIEDAARLQSWFRKRGWHLDMDQWRIASEGNTLNPSIEDIQQQAFEVYQHRVYHDLCGGERTDWEQAEWKLRGNPSFALGVPHDVDDFSVSHAGISPEVRDELYRMGLYNRHQINALDNDARRLLTRWFAGPRFGIDLTQAFGWLSSLKELPEHLDFGKVFAGPPRQVDDLSLIDGIEPANESDLNRIGIYQFQQIANWSVENVLAISEVLNLDDSIIREHWVAQARERI